MNFLELCQDFVSKVGIEGGDGPSDVVGQTGELGNVVRWIKEADQQLNNLHPDWRFLWVRETGLALTVDSDVLPPPALPNEINVLDQGSVWLGAGTAAAKKLTYVPWVNFRRLYHNGVVKGTGKPSYYTIKPDRSMLMDKLADDTYAVSYEYWKKHQDMSVAASEPLLPKRFQRLVVIKALFDYGTREDAPEILRGAAAEYPDLLEKLESQEWPGHEYVTMASASSDGGAGDIVVTPE